MKPIIYKFRNNLGYPDVTVETPGFEEFGTWLTGDLQGSDDNFTDIKKAIEDIKSGNKEPKEFSGNGMLLTLTEEGAIVQCHLAFDNDPSINMSDYPPSEVIDLDTFLGMAVEWLNYRKRNS